jgi:hypothetical protein
MQLALGTAGYTAMLCVIALQRHGVTPDKGDISATTALTCQNLSVGPISAANQWLSGCL